MIEVSGVRSSCEMSATNSSMSHVGFAHHFVSL